MSAELIGRARDVAKYQTYGDIDNLLRDLADALEAAEAFQQVDILANDTLDAGTFSRLTETRLRNEKQMTLVAS